jgi:putative two-component system response regulator
MSDSLTQTQTAATAGPAQILAVDDESYVRDLVCRWLKGAGHVCAQAPNAKVAWEHLRTNEVHLMVLDVNMPGRSGLELLSDVHESYPDTAVLMMTGTGEARTAVDALTHGAWGYLVKPVEQQELVCQVRSALEHRQLRIEQRNYMRNLEEKVRQQTAEIRTAHEETIYRLVAASLCRDEETGTHIKRTGLLSEMLARAAGWSAAEAEIIRMAAPMHDVGKIGIPDAILRKPAKLTPEEFEVMKAHTLIGAKMLEGSKSAILSMAHDIALNHHERWDGTGYPQGLSGPAISEPARIVSIVDVFDALSHDRIYRRALPEGEVLTHLARGAGTQFDPGMVALFSAHYEEVRQLVQANPDELGAGLDVLPLLWPTAAAVPTLFEATNAGATLAPAQSV